MSHDTFKHWICKECQKRAEYSANGIFLCKEHWLLYLNNPKEYFLFLEKKHKRKRKK
jgi:hypothetical protein